MNFQVIGYSDTDVAEYLYKSKPDVNSLLNYLCKDLTKACSTKPPPVPKVMQSEIGMHLYYCLITFFSYQYHHNSQDLCILQDRTPGEPFVAKSDKEAEMEKLLKSMEVFRFYSRFLS